MCGINGIFNFSFSSLQNPENLVHKMNEAILHRGPDGRGTWSSSKDGISMGHQRLRIIDLSEKAHQPMKNANGNVIVFNGEIYNFKEIKKRAVDHTFKSESDTEVLLYLYEKHGTNCLEYLTGMFAFCIWDPKKKELFLARDRVGQKPLYYTTMGGIFAFSSEIKALLTLPWVKAELDEKALYDFLTFGKLPPPLTMFKGIHKFHPGFMMLVDSSGIREYKSYWEVSYADLERNSEDDLIELVYQGLEKSVRYRLVSDVPVGAFLSGGVDSSAMVALMSRYTRYKIKTYSIGFLNQPAYNELEFASHIAKRFGTEHYEKVVTPGDIIEFLPVIVEVFDEPLADATAIPIYFISQLAHEKGTKVVITGDGGDELFAGYRNWIKYIRGYPVFNIYSKLPSAIKWLTARIYTAVNPDSPGSDILWRAYKKQEFFWGSTHGVKESSKSGVLSQEFLHRVHHQGWDSLHTIRTFRENFNSLTINKRTSYLDWMCFLGLKFVLPNLFLYRADRLGMAHSVEVRSPFMDHEFINLILSIPNKFKLVKGEPKTILKKSLEKILPLQVLYRKKMGFCVPLREWVGDIINDYIDRHLNKFCSETGLFNEQVLRHQKEKLVKGNQDYTNPMWTIYFLINWFRRWLL